MRRNYELHRVTMGHSLDVHWQNATVPWSTKHEGWMLPGREITQSRNRAVEIAKRIADAMNKSNKQKLAA